MNHFSQNFWSMDQTTRLPESSSTTTTTTAHDNNDESDVQPWRDVALHEREPMFQKPLTPSDVGKLNRLVIPKQHAEKYFPLGGGTTTNIVGGGGGGDQSSEKEKGLLLSFEDESGKCWRFRYSYWNSSQSYVLTKGWSRYVKEKRLDAGDVVLFERHRADFDRLFIGWRRRGSTTTTATAAASVPQRPVGYGDGGGGSGWSSAAGHRMMYYNYNAAEVAAAAVGSCYQLPAHSPLGQLAIPRQPEFLHPPGSHSQRQRTPPSTTSTPTGNSKTLRLFGVNLECQLDEPSSDPQSSDGSPMSSSQGPTYGYFDYVTNHSHVNHHNHMDINFQMGNRMG